MVPGTVRLGIFTTLFCAALLEQGDAQRALRVGEHGLGLLGTELGDRDDAQLGVALTCVGRALSALGDPGAVPALERAVAMFDKVGEAKANSFSTGQGDLLDAALGRVALAEALASHDRRRAKALAQRAEADSRAVRGGRRAPRPRARSRRAMARGASVSRGEAARRSRLAISGFLFDPREMSEPRSIATGILLGGRYRVEERLGAGGMGVVYRALDERLGREVALKIVSTKGSDSAVRRLQREARAVASLQHPGIATLYDVIDSPDLGVVLVMELVRGASLASLVAHGARPPSEAARIVQDVAESLGAAHRAGLVHRDVKPDNVMVRPDGRSVLLDFGIAKAIHERRETSSDDAVPATEGDTTDGLVVGTPAYLAPEQAMATGEISAAADQFSLAVVAHELLTGQSPWKSATSGAALMSQIVTAKPPRASAARPELGGAVDEVLQQAMQRDPRARFPTIEAFGQALVAAVAVARIVDTSRTTGASVAPPRPEALPFAKTALDVSVVETPRPRSRRAWRWPWVVAGALLLAGGGAAMVVVAQRDSPATTSFTPPAPRAVAYAEIPMSKTASVAAANALRRAMLALRSADDEGTKKALDEAIAADPSFASAHLQRALQQRLGGLYSNSLGASDQAGHDDYLEAASGRDALPPRDAALLVALEPLFNEVPADVATAEARVSALAESTADAQLWSIAAVLRSRLDRTEAAAAAFAREAEVDPQSARALLLRGRVLVSLGDYAGAKAAFERCFRTEPHASTCRFRLVRLLDMEGDCEGFVLRAREFAALAPEDTTAIRAKLYADVYSEVPRAAVEDNLRGLSGFEALNYGAWVHEMYGELGAAVESLGELEAHMVTKRDGYDVLYARYARIIELAEAGEASAALRLAEDYGARAASLTAVDRADELPYVLSVLFHAGRLSAEEREAQLRAWIVRWLPKAETPPRRFALWVMAYARGATSAREADEAMAALPTFAFALQPPRAVGDEADKESIARTLVLAGHPDARKYLDAATSDCRPNFYNLRAQYWSGRAFEAAGDARSACAAYARVLHRWGSAKPRLMTADAARERSRALGCADGGR